MNLSRRDLLAGSTAALAFRTSRGLAATSVITPEHFGARGDGLTNDTDAFARMTAFVNARSGGEIHFRRTTYLLGSQEQSFGAAAYAFAPSKVMEFVGCTGSLVVRGNGARLLCAPGLRYGTFDPVTGHTTHHPMPYMSPGELAAPYYAMISVRGCSGLVEITDLEMDGRSSMLIIGGGYGDTGWQLPATGIHLVDNTGPERLSRLRLHNHCLDGLIIDGDATRAARSLIEDVICEGNGRQGCSITGGRAYTFARCSFSRTGKGAISSAPGAGVDIEAEGGKRVRELQFVDCQFVDNSGPGVVADSSNSEGASFDRCRFVGTTSWAAWPDRPRFRFTSCTFVGAIVHAHGDADPPKAAQFIDCDFRDDPALSPTGQIYGGENPSRPIADLPDNQNVRFSHCRFVLTDRCVLPWTTNQVVFSDCTMSQRSATVAYPRGTFMGRNTIDGSVGLYSARIKGELIVNGKRVSPTG